MTDGHCDQVIKLQYIHHALNVDIIKLNGVGPCFDPLYNKFCSYRQ